MEQDLMDRGIRPKTWDWPDRSKWWLFSNGVTLNQLDGSLVVPEHMQQVSRDLVAAIDETQQGTFQPQRENDELTRALKNQNTLDEPAASAWSHGKLLGPEIPLTRLTERAKPKGRETSCHRRKDEREGCILGISDGRQG